LPWNVVFITLDTTRADRLGAYGFADAGTPTLDRLAREGVLFEQAETAAPLTLPAHCSLFTGRYPFQHGVHENGVPLPPVEQTLAQVLQARGYETAAFTASFVLDARWGLSRGFEHYSGVPAPADPDAPRHNRRPANEVVDQALAWLQTAAGSPFFVWLHLYDAHAPYDVDRAAHPSGYQPAIAFMDAQIDRVIAFLDSRHLRDRTVIIVVGDHGESLGDHGEQTHGLFIYESVMRVPLIVDAPMAGARGRRVSDSVRTVDVLPTLLDIVHVPAPSSVAGVTLVPRMKGRGRAPSLDAYSETMFPRDRFGWSELRAIRSGRFKAIAAPRPELYDLARDPSETENIIDAHPAVVDPLLAKLRALTADARADAGPGLSDRDAVERLSALGYVGAGRAAAPTAELADPKDKLALYLLITSDRTREAPGGSR
jgi:arylsulfatase A-like enzyme